jgi:hypothetical protein
VRNRYAGTCYRCGHRVAPGAGHFERHKGGWRAQHAECAIAYRVAEAKDGGLILTASVDTVSERADLSAIETITKAMGHEP